MLDLQEPSILTEEVPTLEIRDLHSDVVDAAVDLALTRITTAVLAVAAVKPLVAVEAEGVEGPFAMIVDPLLFEAEAVQEVDIALRDRATNRKPTSIQKKTSNSLTIC